MSLLTEHSAWLLLPALLTGAAYAVFLYFRNNNIVFAKKTKAVMACLRGLAVALIAILLLSPMARLSVKRTDKPVVLFAVDNSESIRSNSDSAYYRDGYVRQLRAMTEAFGDRYEVRAFLIGDRNRPVPEGEPIAPDFGDVSTDLASFFVEAPSLYANRNVGAMILLSDGICNKGSNPYYKAAGLGFPVYTIGLGSTELAKDLLIGGIVHNRQALKGNFFPVEVKVSAGRLSGKTARLTVSEDGKELFAKNVVVSGPQYFESVNLQLEAKSAGLHRYCVDIGELDGEVTFRNNHSAFYVEVVESRDRIAIVYNSPHPDVAAIRAALESTDNYDVDVFSADEFKGSLSDYSLVVLHQLPSETHPAAALAGQVSQGGIPALYILGPQSDLSAFNTRNAGLMLTPEGGMTNDASPAYNSNFTAFTFSDAAVSVLPDFPPLKTAFGAYRTSVSADVFLYQKIGGVSTRYPLILFNDCNGVRSGVVTGTGLWQWRLYDYMHAQNHEAFDEVIGKTALYLASKGDRSRFRVHHAKVFSENAPVEFTAELFNDSYELVNSPDVKMVIQSGADTTYEAQFSKQNNGYSLNMGALPAGDYTWTATARIGSRPLEKKGRFSVQATHVETACLVADHDLLKGIADKSGGKFYTKENMRQAVDDIKADNNIRPIATYSRKYVLMLNSPWYLAIVVLLFGTEWFLRKWNGGY